MKRSLEALREKARNFLIYGIGRTLIYKLEKLITNYSLIGNSTFFEPDQFNWVEELESEWMTIRQELDQVLKYRDSLPTFQDISPDQGDYVSTDNRWKTYGFYGYGIQSKQNCQKCPETTRIIEKIPGMKTAFFSILLPGKHIPEHRGPYKGVIRCLLGLRVPEPKENCRIRVGNDIRYWEEGKAMIFDDTCPHEVWNETDGMRVVLFLDIVRPLRFPASWINLLFIKLIAWSPYVQDAMANQKKWEKRLDKVFAGS
ncbi:aspartyl/asparaginyl beta-hydroxylase domain-containing protein [Moorena producens JHB]|uniref:Aspartyl/asparaginyl beta-hydroxylase domain-containing protein n=1 Tax=Moorena producens (strain JHB) TaxID=1454205 RepID=A0A1D9G3H7_MOOP1|nr:aspartyl/asparaginyl beta-hydroxylase domain-containing protein [Moorena producens]AOY81960.1 aspartyl/asparaginyl beta-hydroxylase domain-containing protein [Moorena producens JHB]